MKFLLLLALFFVALMGVKAARNCWFCGETSKTDIPCSKPVKEQCPTLMYPNDKWYCAKTVENGKVSAKGCIPSSLLPIGSPINSCLYQDDDRICTCSGDYCNSALGQVANFKLMAFLVGLGALMAVFKQ